MIILICGSRAWTDYHRILNVVKGLIELYDNIEVIQGEADGADKMARHAAIACGCLCRGYPAKWNLYGKSAGPRRNQEMIDSEHPDIVVAFRSNNSRGTNDMIDRSRRQGIRVIVIEE